MREGDPANEMLFIIRGLLESSTTDGGRSGFIYSITPRPGDFAGEEMLTWALKPNRENFPSSTRTVRALSEVEAFALIAEDLKYVTTQFKRLHSKRIQHVFRYYSHQLWTLSACFIRVAWRRYVKRKFVKELMQQETYYDDGQDEGKEEGGFEPGDSTNNAQQFAANTKRGGNQKVPVVVDPSASNLKMPKLFKPDDSNFF